MNSALIIVNKLHQYFVKQHNVKPTISDSKITNIKINGMNLELTDAKNIWTGRTLCLYNISFGFYAMFWQSFFVKKPI